MLIRLDHIGKRFMRRWIFKDIEIEIKGPTQIAIQGSNGSGKSTLLQIISGSLTPSEGEIHFEDSGITFGANDLFRHVSICAPWLEVIEEFSLNELFDFHFSLKEPIHKMTVSDFAEKIQLKGQEHKRIHHYSSGMKQRVKLGLACFTQSPILLLDEPTTNFDQRGVEWYQEMIQEFNQDRIVIVASNMEREMKYCQERINIEQFKTMEGGIN